MKLHTNDTAFESSKAPDKHSPMSQRILALTLIAIPYLMIILGLLTSTVIQSDASNTIYGVGGYLPNVIVVVLLGLSYSLFKNNPSLRRASVLTFRSYAQSIKGLDEREKLVIDQAFRTSYRIIALTCALVLVCVLINVQTVRLPYHPGPVSIFYIVYGALGLLIYLPPAIVAWKEDL